MAIIIRKAKIEDAPFIANVHINSWKEAYRGILDQSYLDELHLTFKRRFQLWNKIVSNNDIVYVADCDQYGVIGFANAGKNRDERFDGYGEIYAVYLLKKFHHQGIGYQLLQKCFEELKQLEMINVYLWVVERNPTISFYEKSGARKLEYVLEDKIGAQSINELCYCWKNRNE